MKINEYRPIPTLQEARLGSGWTQGKLAELLDTTQATISHIETGKTSPSDLSRRRLESIFGRIDWKRTKEQAIIASNGHIKKETEK